MLGAWLGAEAYLERLNDELRRVDPEALRDWSDQILRVWQQGRFMFVIGNGGSALTASHICEDLAKGTVPDHELREDGKRRLKVLSLTDNVGWMLAVANDLDFDEIFLQQLRNLAGAGDLLLAISGSGNSPNVVKAVEWANDHGMITFGLTGFDGGVVKQLQQRGLHVNVDDMGMIESIHLCLFHWIVDDVSARINAQGRYASQTAARTAAAGNVSAAWPTEQPAAS